MLHFYIPEKKTETKINKIIPLTIASKIIKYLQINLTKKVKDLYTKKLNIIERY